MRDRERDGLADEPGGRAGADPAAGGGPHESVPRGRRPTWDREDPAQGRRGWWLAVLVVVGVTLAFWLAAHLYSFVIDARTDFPDPGPRGGGAGYAPATPGGPGEQAPGTSGGASRGSGGPTAPGDVTPGGPASANPPVPGASPP